MLGSPSVTRSLSSSCAISFQTLGWWLLADTQQGGLSKLCAVLSLRRLHSEPAIKGHLDQATCNTSQV